MRLICFIIFSIPSSVNILWNLHVYIIRVRERGCLYSNRIARCLKSSHLMTKIYAGIFLNYHICKNNNNKTKTSPNLQGQLPEFSCQQLLLFPFNTRR